MKAWKEIYGSEKPYVIPTLYDNGTIGGSTFACACETNSTYAHQFFEGYYDAKSTFGDWIEWYYPMSVGCLVTDFQLHFMDDVTANGRLEARVNDAWITVGTFSVSNYYVANITFSGTQYYSQRYRLVFENCSPSDPAINLYLMTQKTLVDAYKMVKQENVRKYYKYDTSNPTYNYTPVGALVNTNGVLSDFASSRYATIVPPFTPSTNTWEVVFKFTIGSNISSEQYVFCSMRGSSGSYHGIMFELKSSKLSMQGSTNGSSWNINTGSTTTLTANTTYWLKGVFDGSTYKLYLSTDGTNFTQEGSTVTNSNPIYLTTVSTRIGNYGNSTSYPFLGTIDLKGSYINIGGGKWWEGVTYPILPATSSDYDFYKDETVYSAFNI